MFKDVDFWKDRGIPRLNTCKILLKNIYLYFFYIFAWFQAVKHDPNEPQVKSLRARKLKRIIVYWKYYDKEMYDFYHFPHWTSHAISHMIYELNIVEDFIIMYIQRFIIFQYVEFSIWLSVSVYWLSIQKKKEKLKKFRSVKYRWSK